MLLVQVYAAKVSYPGNASNNIEPLVIHITIPGCYSTNYGWKEFVDGIPVFEQKKSPTLHVDEQYKGLLSRMPKIFSHNFVC